MEELLALLLLPSSLLEQLRELVRLEMVSPPPEEFWRFVGPATTTLGLDCSPVFPEACCELKEKDDDCLTGATAWCVSIDSASFFRADLIGFFAVA